MSELIEYTSPIPDGWEIMNFNETYTSVTLNKIKIKQKDYLTKGNYPVVDQGQELIGGYFDNIQYVIKEEPPFLVFGDHTKVKKFINFKFVAGADGVKVLKPNKHINPKLLFFFLHCFKIPDRGYARHFQFLNNAEFPLPPLAEQQRIVAKIEELFSELDKGIETLKTAKQQLKVYRQAVLKYAFEGRLTNPDVIVGELPDGWVERILSEVCDMKAGFFIKADAISDIKIGGKFPCYGGNGLRGYVDSHTHKGVYPIVGRQGALCGNVHLVEGAFHATEHAVVVTVKNSVDVKWLYHKLKHMKLNNYSTGTAQPGLSVNKILPLLLHVPQIAEQIEIVQEIESRLSVCDKIEESIAQGMQQAEALRQSILKKAFEGNLVPQDPNDEPASVLLERIKTERAAAQPEKKSRTKQKI